MATVRVEEAYSERDETIDAKGNVTEVEIPYLVFGVADESAALAAARPKVKTVSGMTLESIEVMERVSGDTWKVKAIYEVDEDGGGDDATDDDEDTTVFAFDTGVTAPCGWSRPVGKRPSRAQASAERNEAHQPVDQDRRTLPEHRSRLRGGDRGGQ